MCTIHEKLLAVQSALKAPKGQTNAFGGYKYRSCEDILEELKPPLKTNGLVLTLSDEIVLIGTRFYGMACAADPLAFSALPQWTRHGTYKADRSSFWFVASALRAALVESGHPCAFHRGKERFPIHPVHLIVSAGRNAILVIPREVPGQDADLDDRTVLRRERQRARGATLVVFGRLPICQSGDNRLDLVRVLGGNLRGFLAIFPLVQNDVQGHEASRVGRGKLARRLYLKYKSTSPSATATILIRVQVIPVPPPTSPAGVPSSDSNMAGGSSGGDRPEAGQ